MDFTGSRAPCCAMVVRIKFPVPTWCILPYAALALAPSQLVGWSLCLMVASGNSSSVI